MADEAAQQQGANEPETSAEIIQLFDNISRRLPAPRGTAEELAEYRRIKPLLLQMLREWELIKSAGGCPIAGRLLGSD